MTVPELRAGELALRRWTPADREGWLALFSDPEVLRFVGDGRVDRERDAAIFERLMALALGPDERFAFVYAAELAGAVVGHVELKQTEHTGPAEWELVDVLARRVWGRGLGSALAAWGVRTAHAHGRRVIATVARDSAASLRILARLGLVPAGELSGGETLLLRERGAQPA
jgi:RimJ/RimL family protein N-acetyltransferase